MIISQNRPSIWWDPLKKLWQKLISWLKSIRKGIPALTLQTVPLLVPNSVAFFSVGHESLD